MDIEFLIFFLYLLLVMLMVFIGLEKMCKGLCIYCFLVDSSGFNVGFLINLI